MNESIPVRVRECPDGSHPDGDVVYLRPKLDLEGGIAARQDVDAVRSTNEDLDTFLIRRWMVTFCKYGATGWNLHDKDKTEPWPFDVDVLLADHDLAYPVADKADDLYRESVMRPLLARLSPTSPDGETATSTSRPMTSTGTPRRRSSRRSSAGMPSQAPTA
jgi:hypothetical protein